MALDYQIVFYSTTYILEKYIEENPRCGFYCRPRMVLGIGAATGIGSDHVWSVTSGQHRSICQRHTDGDKHNGCTRWVGATIHRVLQIYELRGDIADKDMLGE